VHVAQAVIWIRVRCDFRKEGNDGAIPDNRKMTFSCAAAMLTNPFQAAHTDGFVPLSFSVSERVIREGRQPPSVVRSRAAGELGHSHPWRRRTVIYRATALEIVSQPMAPQPRQVEPDHRDLLRPRSPSVTLPGAYHAKIADGTKLAM
jgi:hypothetical protein